MTTRARGANDRRDDWLEVRAAASGDEVELRIHGPIGGGFFFDEDAVTGKNVAKILDELDPKVRTIRLLVNSPGGAVFDAIHIANALRRQRDEHGREVVAEIEALAASAATIITSSASVVRMPRNALFMVHNPWIGIAGDASDLRNMADVLDRVRSNIIATYQWLSGLSAHELGELMDATSWLDADEALEAGLVTEIAAPIAAAARIDFSALERLDIPEDRLSRLTALFDGARPNDGPEGENMKDRKKEPTEGATPEPKAPTASEPATPVDLAAVRAEAAKAERERAAAITAAVRAADLGDEFAERMISSGVTLEDARAKVIEALVDRSTEPGIADTPSGPIRAGVDERERRADGIAASLLVRGGYAGMVAEARTRRPDMAALADAGNGGEFRGMSLLDMARASLERARPGATRGRSATEIAGDFLAAAGGQTTDDFSVGLENALNKTLLASFAITPDTWRKFCGVGSVSDFRAHSRFRTGYIGSLGTIVEGAEYTSLTVPDAAKESITATTKGGIVELTRQAIVNDDLGMFMRVAAQVGRTAGLTIETAVYTLLAENSNLGPTMNDGVSMFHANHGNIGSGAAISAAAVDADAALMAAQQDPNSQEYLDLHPAVLLVPRGLRGSAIQINESQFDPDTAASNKPNFVLGLFDEVVATPRLSGTRRYMFADPAIAPAIEVAFLDGEQEPYMELEQSFSRDSTRWKIRLDYGVAGIEYRAAVTDAGV